MAVFISYARKDRKRVTALADHVELMGIDAWHDADLHAGDTWWPTILDNIGTRDLFLVALSRHWLASPACRAEHDYARDLKRTVVPVQIRSTRWRRIPDTIASVEFVDYRHRTPEAFSSLETALRDAPHPPAIDPASVDPPPMPRPDPPWRRGVALLAIVCLVAVGALVWARWPEPEHGTVVTVAADVAWTDSGIDLADGDQVTISADGQVWHSEDPGSRTGPAGDANPVYDQYNVIEDANHAALIGRVGDEAPRAIGAGAAFTVGSPGRLWLGINDQGTTGNRGHYRAVVEVEHASR